MAGGLARTHTTDLLKASLNGIPFDSTNHTFVALLTGAATSTSAGQEVDATGNSYARQDTFQGSPDGYGWTINGNVASNETALNFTGMPQVQVVAINVMDAASGGNRRWWADLTNPRSTLAGDTISFSPGSIQFTVGS